MPFSHEDRQKILAVPLCGPKTVEYLEMIGYGTFAALAGADAGALRVRINAHLGWPHINRMGVRAFENLIAAARMERGDK